MLHRRAAPCPEDEETEVCLFIHLTHTREVPPSCQAVYWGYTKTDKISMMMKLMSEWEEAVNE